MESESRTIFYICNDPERALGPEAFMPGYHIVCIDNSPILEFLKDRGVSYFSLGEALKHSNTIFRNSNKLLTHELVRKYLDENRSENGKNYLQFFKIAPNSEVTAKNLGYRVVNTTSELNHMFENKISQYELLSKADVSFPKTVIAVLGEVNYKDLALQIGDELVIQFDRGHTGSGTNFINSEGQFNEVKAQFPRRKVRIAKKIDGEAWTLNACVTRFGIVYGGLCYQITGIPSLTSELGGTVGNDWTQVSRLSEEVISKIGKLTEKVGEIMKDSDYKGLFGIDLIVTNEGEVYLIEVNARQPASTGMHTKLMLHKSQIPLMAFHMAEFLYEDDFDYLSFLNKTFKQNLSTDNATDFIKLQNSAAISAIDASQVILRNRTGAPINVKAAMKPGEYSQSGDFIKDAYSIDQISPGNFLLLHCAVGQKISAGSEIARIQSWGSVISGEKLKPQYDKIIEEINKNNQNFIKVQQLNTQQFTNDGYTTKELPAAVQEYIRRYFELPINGNLVPAPYFRNVKRVRAELRVLVGKGTPEELVEETLIYAKLRGYNLNGKSVEETREFMREQGLGVDCSAFVAHVYNFYLKNSGKGALWTKIKYPSKGLYRTIVRMLRPIENLGAETLTSLDNCTMVELSEIEPGDLIRMKGIKGGHHLAMVYNVKYDRNGTPLHFTYVHSISRYGKNNGVRFGEVLINNIYGELKDQNWLERDEDGTCWTLMELEKDYEDNGLRRPKFKPEIK